eukprot:3774628-Pleurochrysis_carterae.AAC.1
MVDANGMRRKVLKFLRPRGGEGGFKLWRQSVHAGLGCLRARRCAVQARSLRHAGLPNSSTAIL